MTSAVPRVMALLATYNEERFIGACLEHLRRQEVDAYVIDNCSTDQTLDIVHRYLGRGVVGVETFPRRGVYSWRPILERKERLASTLDADWFMHADPDEIRLPLRSDRTLRQSFAELDAQGYNAVNFQEFTFVPTQEAPDHDHKDFQKTMRWYYPFLPSADPHRVNAWKRQSRPVELAWSGGHHVRFSGLRIFPQWLPMRHYLFLSIGHAVYKYIERGYDSAEVSMGWHRLRASLYREMIRLPSATELRLYRSDDQLDASNPRSKHYLFDEAWATGHL
jgi:glycosyltransferase involved in cell wall biosynthesis